ncbi:MAG TPA: hypothetical protein VFP36_13180 [Usitatibacter sp.]|nr:hypothetical protein [Usitatibacter sp.]
MAERIPSAGAGFLVDDFITSITTQLDRVQDALRIKAVNRPLTYALRELHLELKVFVDMDAQGQVLLRPAGPNEPGASTLAMDFTTITKPMIEENTISLAAARSTPLEKLGLRPEEQMRLERIGVTNLAQLERLKGSTGVGTVARLAELPVDRLRRVLQAGLPQLGPAPPKPAPPAAPPSAPPSPLQPGPVFTGPVKATPVLQPPAPKPGTLPLPGLRQRFLRPMRHEEDLAQGPVLAVDPQARELALPGRNLLHEDYPPEARLNGEALEVRELEDDRLVVRLPEGFTPGALEVRFGPQAPHRYDVVHADAADSLAADPWTPAGSAP